MLGDFMKLDFFVQDFLLKTFTYEGRTSRGSFWLTQAAIFAILLVMVGSMVMMSVPLAQIDFSLSISNAIIAIPTLALITRRLHDVNRSAWNLLWFLTGIGAIYIVYLNVKNGTQSNNDYGKPSGLYPNTHLNLMTIQPNDRLSPDTKKPQ
jgi:uncharacterized membrane protein YhaH (DUF805 family)